jgi:hypothetical protein
MKRYCGCISPDERREENVWRWGTNSRKNIAAFFKLLYFFCCEMTVERKEAWLTGKASRNKGNDQRERLIAFKLELYIIVPLRNEILLLHFLHSYLHILFIQKCSLFPRLHWTLILSLSSLKWSLEDSSLYNLL